MRPSGSCREPPAQLRCRRGWPAGRPSMGRPARRGGTYRSGWARGSSAGWAVRPRWAAVPPRGRRRGRGRGRGPNRSAGCRRPGRRGLRSPPRPPRGSPRSAGTCWRPRAGAEMAAGCELGWAARVRWAGRGGAGRSRGGAASRLEGCGRLGRSCPGIQTLWSSGQWGPFSATPRVTLRGLETPRLPGGLGQGAAQDLAGLTSHRMSCCAEASGAVILDRVSWLGLVMMPTRAST